MLLHRSRRAASQTGRNFAHRLNSRAVRASVAGALTLLLSLALGCGTEPDKPDATADAADAAEDVAVDTGAETTVDAGVKLTQKWAELQPETTAKMNAMAVLPGKTGSYVIVGDKATVLLFQDGEFTDISPTTIGAVRLNAVWAAADGTIVAAGEGSMLVTYDGTGWQVAGSVPPTPPVVFRAIAGNAKGLIWAVGEGATAYVKDGAVWAAASVTATSGEGIGDGADFVGVQVTEAGAVWVAADQGAKSPGLVLQSADGKAWTGHGTLQAPRGLWAHKTDASKSGGVVVVGGTTSEYVATWDGKAFKAAGDVKWSLGFRAVMGISTDLVWAGALKGQVRTWDGKAWSVDVIAPPVGTVGGFPQPSSDVVALAAHTADERCVLTNYKLYRYGMQP
ncbi:MAG: hypothetical protein KC502_09640 [Myxococcales bacterium]|nr:hypothetical protein [Myxococcales bacterium]